MKKSWILLLSFFIVSFAYSQHEHHVKKDSVPAFEKCHEAQNGT
jgi:uncharacterized membrane protein